MTQPLPLITRIIHMIHSASDALRMRFLSCLCTPASLPRAALFLASNP